MQRAGRSHSFIRGVIAGTAARRIQVKTVSANRRWSINIRPERAGWGRMIWQAMCGSGRRIGTMRSITAAPLRTIR